MNYSGGQLRVLFHPAHNSDLIIFLQESRGVWDPRTRGDGGSFHIDKGNGTPTTRKWIAVAVDGGT